MRIDNDKVFKARPTDVSKFITPRPGKINAK
jgi:hypothetical protein